MNQPITVDEPINRSTNRPLLSIPPIQPNLSANQSTNQPLTLTSSINQSIKSSQGKSVTVRVVRAVRRRRAVLAVAGHVEVPAAVGGVGGGGLGRAIPTVRGRDKHGVRQRGPVEVLAARPATLAAAANVDEGRRRLRLVREVEPSLANQDPLVLVARALRPPVDQSVH